MEPQRKPPVRLLHFSIAAVHSNPQHLVVVHSACARGAAVSLNLPAALFCSLISKANKHKIFLWFQFICVLLWCGAGPPGTWCSGVWVPSAVFGGFWGGLGYFMYNLMRLLAVFLGIMYWVLGVCLLVLHVLLLCTGFAASGHMLGLVV